MSNQVSKARNRAFLSQRGLCYYCQQSMWFGDAKAFARIHGINLRKVHWHQLTAEHLIERQRGGGGGANIVAACRFCNLMRHRGRQARAPSPDVWQRRVRQLVLAGRWPRVPLPLEISENGSSLQLRKHSRPETSIMATVYLSSGGASAK
jgi:hypothetical protein